MKETSSKKLLLKNAKIYDGSAASAFIVDMLDGEAIKTSGRSITV